MSHVIACNVGPKDRDGKLLHKWLTRTISELLIPAQASLGLGDMASYLVYDMASWTTESSTQGTLAQGTRAPDGVAFPLFLSHILMFSSFF
eukprot:3812364-Ditylum_brightwellii.AAC.1